MAKEQKAKRATNLANPTAATVFTQKDDSTKAAAVPVPAGAHTFYVRAKGTVTGGTTTNFTPVLQVHKLAGAADFVTAATAGNNTTFFTGGAAAYNSASGPFVLEVLCVADPTNKIVGGVGWGINGSAGTAVAQAAATPVTTGQIATLDPNQNTYGFSVTGLFSASNGSNLAILDDLSVEVLAMWER
jgi:hypothetical protein